MYVAIRKRRLVSATANKLKSKNSLSNMDCVLCLGEEYQ